MRTIVNMDLRNTTMIFIKTNKMKITVTNIKKILEKEYGWFHLDSESYKWLVDGIIEDTLKIIDDKLKYHKNISIK